MLDIKFIRENTEAVKANLVNRHNDFDLDEVIELDRKRRELLQMTEALKSERNAKTKKIAIFLCLNKTKLSNPNLLDKD